MNFYRHRPQEHVGPGDRLLVPLIDELTELMFDTQLRLNHASLMLPEEPWAQLSHVLVEFGEDLHCDIGIWRSLEGYNQEFFGTPLPFVIPVDRPANFTPSTSDRICYLLWVLYQELEPNMTLSPGHRDLRLLADAAAAFLTKRLAHLPKYSGIKSFLSGSNRHGWDVKRKLIWLGQHSYLFRLCFDNYVEAHGGRVNISTIDSYVSQEPTSWSGLGVIDLLAAILPLKEKQQATLRSWYERHMAYYQLTQVRRTQIKAINVVNNEPYDIQMDDADAVFRSGQIIFGSLYPWEGRWYWSGEQADVTGISEGHLQEACEALIQQNPRIVYRYDPQRLEAAQAMLGRLHHHFVNYHRDDFVVYPTGQAMTSSLRQRYHDYHQLQLADAPASTYPADIAALADGPSLSYPPEVTEHEDGIGLFFSPVEGMEFMIRFNTVISGLGKKGVDLTEDEVDVLQGLIRSEALSPAFVQRAVRDYGTESIAAVFLLRGYQDQSDLDYLLRRYKGHYYRRRYPNLSIV